jgi:hypothetical protein
MDSRKSNQSRNLAAAGSFSFSAITVEATTPVVGQVFAQLADQFGVFGEALHQDLAGAVEHRLGVGKARLALT